MKPIVLAGIILIVLGVIALSYHGVTYKTHEQIVKIGPLEATKETEKTVPFPPALEALALGGGIVLVIIGLKSGSGR